MKKTLMILFAMLAAGALYGQASESFSITVTVNFVDFALRDSADLVTYPGWAIGNLNAAATSTMSRTQQVLVKNQSNIDLDFKAYSTSAAPAACGIGTPTAWTPGAASGADTYVLEMGVGTVGAPPVTYNIYDGTNPAGADLVFSADPEEDFRLYSKLTAPTTVSDGCAHEILVFVVATAP